MKTALFTISNPKPNCYDLNPHKTISKNCLGCLMLGTWGITKNLPYSLPASYLHGTGAELSKVRV